MRPADAAGRLLARRSRNGPRYRDIIRIVLWHNALLAAVISICAATPGTIYRIELSGNQIVWSEDLPRDSGALVLFHRYPGGMLVSVKKADVRRVAAAPRVTEVAKKVQSGRDIKIGTLGAPTASGSGAAKASPEGFLLPPGGEPLRPGERPDGTALLNPDRPYRPEWDSTRVPGQDIPFPNSPNDYREGKTFAYPPAGAVQDAPGEPPKMPPSSGEPPKAPQ